MYLVRQQGELTIHTDHHILGLFTKKIREQTFLDAGLDMQKNTGQCLRKVYSRRRLISAFRVDGYKEVSLKDKK